MTQLPKSLEKAFDELGDYHEVNGEDVYDPPVGKELKKFLLTVYLQGRKDAVEYVKEHYTLFANRKGDVLTDVLEAALNGGEKEV